MLSEIVSLPGHNHYSNCTCGWCIKTSGPQRRRRTIDRTADLSSARQILEESGASQSWSACYVNPNATCPVCFARVYFYQNSNFSKVYFDELGWPWPKHPCTDQSSQIGSGRARQERPTLVRTKRKIDELLQAARDMNFKSAAKFALSYGVTPGELLQVVCIKRRKREDFLEARSLSRPHDESAYFSFRSRDFLAQQGDIASWDGKFLSTINPRSLQPERFSVRKILKGYFEAL
jgi:hypothetical protein